MEFWDILDKDGNKTGRTVERGKPMKTDEYHLVVHVWIKNNLGEYLITKRTPNKTYPNMWETIGGSAITGDDSLSAALREVKEEIGVTLDHDNGRKILGIKRQTQGSPDFLEVWLFNREIAVNNLVLQPNEVCDAKWASKEEILLMIEKGEFVNVFTYLDYLFEL